MCNEKNSDEEKKSVSLINIEAEKLGETVHEVYTDGLKTTVQATGNLLSLIPRWLRIKLWPYEKNIAEQELECKKFYQYLEKRLEGKEIVSPERYIAIPLLQAISFSYDCKELHELYATLLANAMIPDTKNSAHPAFVDIIRQLSPIEAKLIKETAILQRPLPICEVFFESKKKIGSNTILQYSFSSGSIWIRNLTLFDQFAGLPTDTASALIENLIRLGLIEKPETLQLADYQVDKEFEKTQQFLELQQEFEKAKKEDEQLYLLKKVIVPTEFGKLFYEMCVK